VRLAVLLLIVVAARVPALAGPLPRKDVPEPLRPWIDWVLRDHEEAGCPIVAAPASPDPQASTVAGARRCTWPTRTAPPAH